MKNNDIFVHSLKDIIYKMFNKLMSFKCHSGLPASRNLNKLGNNFAYKIFKVCYNIFKVFWGFTLSVK